MILFTNVWLNAALLYLVAVLCLLTIDLWRRAWRRRNPG